MRRHEPTTMGDGAPGVRRDRLAPLRMAALLLLPCPLGAQWLPTSSMPVVPAPAPQTHRHPPTYWFEGAVIGAAVLGGTTVMIMSEFCSSDDARCDLGGTLWLMGAGSALGSTLGALIGGSFRAPHPRPLRGHPARSALLGGAVAAVWSFGLFAQGCLNGCRPYEIRIGALTTTLGTLAGLLVGL